MTRRSSSKAATPIQSSSDTIQVVPRTILDDWSTKEKLLLASLAIEHKESWLAVRSSMRSFLESDILQNQCAAHYEKLKEDEPELAQSLRGRSKRTFDPTIYREKIYRKLVQRRIEELKKTLPDRRVKMLSLKADLDLLRSNKLKEAAPTTPSAAIEGATSKGFVSPPSPPSGSVLASTSPTDSNASTTMTPNPDTISKPTTEATLAPTTSTPNSTQASASPSGQSTATEQQQSSTTAAGNSRQQSDTLHDQSRPASSLSGNSTITTSNTQSTAETPTRVTTRRESSRQQSESNKQKAKRLMAVMFRDTKQLVKLLDMPTEQSEIESYNSVILKPIDLAQIKKKMDNWDNPMELQNNLLLMFQNACMFYPESHPTHQAAQKMWSELLPKWDQAMKEFIPPGSACKEGKTRPPRERR